MLRYRYPVVYREAPLSLLIHLALRSLLRSRLSFALLVAAVAVGVGFQVPNAANLDGYTRELMRQGVTRASGHVMVTGAGSGLISPAAPALAAAGAVDGVRAVAPRILHAGVIFQADEKTPTRIVGVDPAAEQRASGLCDCVARGRCLAADDAEGLLLGGTLAEELGVEVGNRLKLVIPYEELGEVEYASRKYPVVGVLRGGGGFQEDEDVWVTRRFLEVILEEEDAATALLVFAEEDDPAPAAVEPLAARLEAALAAFPVTVRPWHRVSSFVANAIAGNRTVARISMIMVIIAVAIPVLALLYIHALHERRQVAITVAIGFGRRTVFVIYLVKAAIVGAIGCCLGAGVGALLCLWFDAHPIFASDGFVVRPVLSAPALLWPAAVVFLVTIVSGVIPAWKAASADPATELREE